jgi:hypothetical protein
MNPRDLGPPIKYLELLIQAARENHGPAGAAHGAPRADSRRCQLTSARSRNREGRCLKK